MRFSLPVACRVILIYFCYELKDKYESDTLDLQLYEWLRQDVK